MSRPLGWFRIASLGAAAVVGAARASPAQVRSCTPAGSASDSSAAAFTVHPWAPPLDRVVAFRARNISLRDALDRMAVVAKLRVAYSADVLPLDRITCVEADHAPVGDVLLRLLEGTNVSAVGMGDDQVVLAPRAPSATTDDSAPPQMAHSMSVLDRVVVTGSAVGAPERELTVSLNVLDGKQLERQNSENVSTALDSYVPGMWSWTQSPTNMLTSYGSIRGASSFGLSYPKIYIDGIEVANPLLITRFNPGAIDHIEVIRGPQGSALYGTDAISGVLNIVTRHDGVDAAGAVGSVRTTAGVTQSDYGHSVLTQDHAVSLVAGSNTRSAEIHVSGGSIGDFIPSGYSRNLTADGSTRVVGERSMLVATARYFMQEAGTPSSPLLARNSYAPPGGDAARMQAGAPFDADSTTPQSVQEYTVGATATFAPNDRWTHSFVAGVDGYRLANVEANLTPIPNVADSALRAAQGGADRATLRASSVLLLHASDATRATFTFSAEHSTLRERSVSDWRFEAEGRNTVTRLAPRELVGWQDNTGLTTQANLSFDNTAFLTAGMRAERDSRLTTPNRLAMLPLVGMAIVNDYGPLSVKVRAAYGQGIRPPSALGHSEFWQTASATAQPRLGPERQTGTEVGVDLYVQRAFSLQLTRFDQRASGLIQQVALPADSSATTRRMVYALENVGEIANTGWELGATGNVSRLSATGTLSFVDSRVMQLAPGYNGDLKAGDRMLLVPSRTGSVNLSWLGNHWTGSLGASRALDWINYDELGLAQAFMAGTQSMHDLLGPNLREYWRRYNGGLRVRASASREFRHVFSFEISADNLLNYQRDEPDNLTVLPGRTLMTGLRVKF